MLRLFAVLTVLAYGVCFPTTPPLPPPRSGCEMDGEWYQPGDTIIKGQIENWCYESYCGYDGHIIHADNFNCMTTPPPPLTTPPPPPPRTTPPPPPPPPPTTPPPPPTTPPPPPPPTTPPPPPTTPPPPPPTTPPSPPTTPPSPPTTPPTAPTTTPSSPTTPPPPPTPPPFGCEYDGKWFSPGEVVYSGQSDNWCYSASCGDDGNLVHADNFHC